MVFVDLDSGDEIAPYLCLTPDDVKALAAFLGEVLAHASDPPEHGGTFMASRVLDGKTIAVALLRSPDAVVDLEEVRRETRRNDL